MAGRPGGIGSHAWELVRMRVFGMHGHVCWVCLHPGARTVDHVEPVTERPDLALSLSNLRPAHGARNRCAVCGQCCNQLKGGMSLARARRIIAERMAARPAPPAREPACGPDAGRAW